MIDQLITLISREAELFEAFLALLEKQKRALVENDAATLNSITELQREKLVESQLLNKKRQELVAQIARFGNVSDDLTLSKLLEMADESQAEKLTTMKDLILDLNDRIAQARNRNVMLLNQSREFISKTMTMLSKLNSPESTYARDGGEESSVAAVVLDRRA